jgi:hypothetical protein
MEMAPAVQIADYGKWESPITAELLFGYSITLNEVQTNVRFFGDVAYPIAGPSLAR